MDKANSVKNKLIKLCNEDKIQTLFFDEESDTLIILDLETIEYKGVYIKYRDKDSIIEINTATNSLKVNNNGKISRGKIDPIISKNLDRVAVEKFNVKKLDEDYFTDLEETIDDEISEIHDDKSREVYQTVRETLKEVHDKNYDKDFIIGQMKKFNIIEKKDHFNLERYVGATKVKYNSAKNKITVRNDYNFKEKFEFKDVVSDFNTGAFLEIVKNYYHKRAYDKRRLSLDDAFIDPYPVFTHTAALGDKDKGVKKEENN
ncbi:hypothetical protein [uncultured Anaerococcus sp.]|uniref:hypothetical protein n=1 Tax=uncultured Anaerococcus sp. TaxID=293428 RepID=UPI0025DAF393|nr:hypothetical protein [uncultured Anaerococcus sp.]